MTDIRCPKCKSDLVYLVVDVEIDINEREFCDDPEDMVNNAIASGDEVTCGDCNHTFELGEDDGEDEG